MNAGSCAQMTNEEFKNAMLRGQGRCVYALQYDCKKYFNEVMWACENEISYDPQCGSHSEYTYKLISPYEDKTPFLNALLKSFENAVSDGGWKVLYLAEILNYFSLDGSKTAKDALWGKYHRLLNFLREIKIVPEGLLPQRDDFDSLCEIIIGNYDDVHKIAADIGELFLNSSVFDVYDFEWSYLSKVKKFITELSVDAERDERIAVYVKKAQEYEEEERRRAREHKRSLTDGVSSELSKIRENANQEEQDYIHKLIYNYPETNRDELVQAVKEIKVDFQDSTDWHSVQSDILDMEENGVHMPPELLLFIYGSTFCARCRNRAVQIIIDRGLFTEELAHECLNDSESDTAQLAYKWLKCRNKI